MQKIIIALVFVMSFTSALAHTVGSKEVVLASWYGPGFHGKMTANGEIFDSSALTAAHKTLPFDTLVKVTYKGREVIVRINDRGPFIEGRSLDLSEAAAQVIGCAGVCKVTMEILN